MPTYNIFIEYSAAVYIHIGWTANFADVPMYAYKAIKLITSCLPWSVKRGEYQPPVAEKTNNAVALEKIQSEGAYVIVCWGEIRMSNAQCAIHLAFLPPHDGRRCISPRHVDCG